MERAPITVVDGIPGTPGSHTFNPNGETKGIHLFENRAGGIPIGNERLTISVIAPSDRTRGLYVVTMKLWSPTLEQTSASTATGIQPAPTVAYTTTAELTFKLPARSTKQARVNVRAMAVSLLGTSTAISAIDDLEDLW